MRSQAALRRSLLIASLVSVSLAAGVSREHAQGFGHRLAPHLSGNRPDSSLVMGPNTYTSTSSTQWTYYALTYTIPNFDPLNRYFFRITNGDTTGSLMRVSQMSVLVDGKEMLNTSDVSTSVSALNKVVQITAATTTFQFGVRGALNSYVKVKLYATPDPSYEIYGGSYEIPDETGFAIFSDAFTKSSNMSGPWTLVVNNGNPDGSARCTNVRVTLNGTVITNGVVGLGTASVMRQVTLLSDNNVSVRLYGDQGARASLSWTATDTTAPTVNLVRPTEAYVTDSASVATTATVADQSAQMTVTVGSLPPFYSTAGFTVAAPLPIDGLYTLKVRVVDRAGYATEVTRHVIRDTAAPVVWINSPPANAPTVTTDYVTVSGVWSDTSITAVTVDGDLAAAPDSSGTFSVSVPLDLGPNGILLRARDAVGHVFQTKRYVYRASIGEPAPRDSSQINLTQVDDTQGSTFRDQVGFLYRGADPYQSANDTLALIAGREAVVRGRVLARDFGSLPGVSVRVLDHPEFGESVTRADGTYSLVVNGGGALVLRFIKTGFLESQRVIDVPIQDYAMPDDVALIGRSGRSYQVDNDSMRVVEGRFESDANGDRRLWMIVPQGTAATVTPSGGSPIQYSSFRIRLKEFTVGSSGEQSMPGTLPPSTAYTYCVGVSLVEADSILGTQPFGTLAPDITFNQPIITYTREFLGMRVGSPVPTGVYDSHPGKWVARPDGWVVRIAGSSGGLATLDTDGDGAPDGDARYASLGITTAERARLLTMFAIGDSLLRVPVDHFSALDHNYNEGANRNARATSAARAGPASSVVDDPSCSVGCVIENENRVLGETIPLRGVPYSLHYRSSRQPGDRAMRWIRVPLAGATRPDGLLGVRLQVDVAGRRFKYHFDAAGAPSVYVFRDWDGKDAFGRPVNGSVTATVRIGNEFLGLYASGGTAGRGFGNGAMVLPSGGTQRTGDRAGALRVMWTTQQVSVGAPNMASAGLGGWTITPHHFYDVNGRGTLYFGDGSMRIANQNFPIIQIFAGSGLVPQPPLPDSALVADVAISPADMAFASDGSLYAISGGARVVRIKNGKYYLVAGTHGGGQGSLGADGAPAAGQGLQQPGGIAVGPDGTVYFADAGHHAVFKVSTDGRLFRVAGTTNLNGSTDDDVLATDHVLAYPISVAVGPDGSLFIGNSDQYDHRIYRVGTDGRIRAYAGLANTGAPGPNDVEGRAVEIAMNDATDLDVDADGNLYIAEYANDRIRRVAPDGQLTTFKNLPGDRPQFLDVAPDGGLYVFTASTRAVVRIDPDGSMTPVAGGYGTAAFLDWTGENLGYARAATFGYPGGVALGPDGAVYTGEGAASVTNNGIRRIVSDLPGAVAGEIEFPSQDGRQVFVFNDRGRHLRTMNAATGDTVFSFGYQDGRLVTIRDSNHDVTTIIRDAAGSPAKIVGPYQAENLLTLTGGYLTEVRNAAASPAEAYAMTYETAADAGGLLRTFQNPRGFAQTFTYKLGATDQDDGRLADDLDAAGGHQTYALEDLGTVRRVTRTSPEHRVTQYQITQMLDGLRSRYVQHADVSQTYVADSLNLNTSQPPVGEVVVATGSAGDVTTSMPARDKRYGMLAKIPAQTITRLPSGLVRTLTSSREYGADGSTTETVGLNGAQLTSVYNASLRTLTTTTPENRTSTVTLDDAGRPTSLQVGTLLPVHLVYDSRGKLSELTQGDRGWRYGYDDLGRLQVVRDTLQRMTRFTYDGADRVASQDLPGGRVVSYAYDANGNLIGLTPPGTEQHRFEYTQVDLTGKYTPPDLLPGS
jgi:YD repeat-containing protein